MVRMYKSIDAYIETNLISEYTLTEVEVNSLVYGLSSFFSYYKTFYLMEDCRLEFL